MLPPPALFRDPVRARVVEGREHSGCAPCGGYGGARARDEVGKPKASHSKRPRCADQEGRSGKPGGPFAVWCSAITWRVSRMTNLSGAMPKASANSM